ncbi:conserved hypothetical protein [Haloterrigena turkmenica DSM 5511]|uniref:Uncharacterized protein n=1 Tax=Haloterrigena turkmenica (strain ATCC 51198 / DSM 5511 / JCM 9101 / NCIMB 13204 / VKM B-1734 / 4k) TaxID=543526 RepID=D2RVH2_HALTV|nr:DUF5790 family protein [Haloterrigena turkmenica]ADB59336.1 conserved hypothetical protein [Haloterrigena turkmenica DSM 5511]
MSQATFGDDEELFGEAANEMRADVESSLEDGWAALPDADDVWETDADNVLGVLNGLNSALNAGDAEEHLRDAKKWFTMGQRADAFEDADDLEAEIGDLEDAIADISEAGEQVGELTSTIPALRGTLEDAGPDTDAEADDEAEDADDEEDEAEADDADEDESDEDEE